ncbi:MAG: DUF4340 domain-containing protein [Spirochaetia bacterium]|jgi:hypothetical protein
MSRRGWTLIGVLVVLGVLVGAYFFVTRPKPAPAAAAVQPELSKGEKDKLVKVVLSDRPEGTLTLVKKAGKWNTEPPAAVPLEPTTIEDLLFGFSALNAERIIEEHPSDLGQYGLAPPRAMGTGTWEDGTSHTLLLGDKTPSGSTYYIQVKGNPRVYTVQSFTGQHLHWTLKDLRSRTISPAINYDEVEYVKIVERDGAVLEVKRKTEAETKSFQLGFGPFLLTRPYVTVRGLDAQKQDTVIKGAQSVSISDFAEEPVKGLDAYGLARPRAEVIVRDKSNTIDYIFGDQKGTQTWFALRGQPGVYLVDTSSLDFLKTKPFDIVDKFTFIPNLEDVDRMDITAGGKTHTLVITRTTKKAAKQGDPDVVTAAYTADGKTVEEDSFKKFYQSLIGLQLEGEMAKRVPNAPEVSVTFSLNKGEVKTVRIDYAPYDRDFDAIFLNGVGEFALTKGQLRAMLAKLDLLIAGKKVTD